MLRHGFSEEGGMEITIRRSGGLPIREQIVVQLELRILDGSLAPGSRLPSVRALARRLRVHANTVSAAYKDLEASGHVRLRRGSGVFVREAGSRAPQDARELDEMIRLALRLALDRGFGAAEIRSAVERWLAAAPPGRIVVVDPVPEMAAIVAAELGAALAKPVLTCTLEALEGDPGQVSGALVVVLPYHVEAVRRLVPSAAVELVNLEISEAARRTVLALPEGAVVLCIASSPTLLPFATLLFRGLRGEQILVEAHALSDGPAWRRLLPAADLVVADVVAAAGVRHVRPRRLNEVHLVSPASVERLKAALEVVAPPLTPLPDRGGQRG
jgi:DNA-binding transcriptional regulator YhcF (GntR family)